MVSQYLWDFWGTDRGFPGGSVSSIAQSPDGYLWIGTDRGLVRFDGLNFQRFEQAGTTSFPIGPVRSLLSDHQGNLWILLETTKLLRYHDGMFDLMRGEAENGISAVGRGTGGEVLISSLATGALRFDGERFVSLSSTSAAAAAPTMSKGQEDLALWSSTDLLWSTGLRSHRLSAPTSSVNSMATTADGKIWLGTEDSGLFYLSGGQAFAVNKGLPDERITCLLALESPELWIGTGNGLVRWTGTRVDGTGVPEALQHVAVLSMVRDRDSNIWVGTRRGLLRFNAKGVSRLLGQTSVTEAPVTALFEDREGNLWAGGRRGIERLRDSAFVTYSGGVLQSETSGPIHVDEEGRTWFAPLEGGLHWLKEGKEGSVTNDGLGQDVVYSITGKNDLWVGRQRGGLTHLIYGSGSVSTKTYTKRDGLAQNGVYAVYRGDDGAVWAATLSGGVSKYSKGSFTTYSTADGMASNTISSIAESPDGTMWFGTPNGLNAFSNGKWRLFTVRDGMPSDDVYCLLSDKSDLLWIGTASGLALLRGGHVQPLGTGPASLHEPIMGMAEDGNGRLWIATSNHVLALKRNQVVGGAYDPNEVREYGLEDGLQGIEGVKRQSSVFADTFGRVWFSTNRGISFVDTRRLVDSWAPAVVHIESLAADGDPIELKLPVRVPPGEHRITFNCSGLSLAVPERIRFRYFLEGFDRSWSEPTAARQIAYTNLHPGSYRFRVVASNSAGIWNSAESTLPFEIERAFWQTWWFRLSGVLMVALIALLFVRLRMLKLSRQLNTRFEERLAERTRIAQELHDTLLQGLLSASMQLHVADERLAASSPAKPIVGRVLELMGYVIEEGRNAVRGLRSSRGALDLEQALSRVREEFPIRSEIEFRVIVEGTPRPLRPIVSDEVYLIGREALSNAFQHSRARGIEVELEYATSHLRVLVRDNGEGIDPEVVRSGRDGHWGLSGMKERTERIGGKLRVLSHGAAGTEVELSVPGRIAFDSRPEDRGLAWLSRFYPGKQRNEKSESEREQVR
jgi:signal transduction histidine kinase/ligand-binding sensor domain-containing protein